MIDGEPFSGATPAAHHLIGYEKDLVLVADLPEARHVLFRRDQDAVRFHNRLHHHRGDIAFVPDHMVDVFDARDLTFGVNMVQGALVTMDLGWKEYSRDFCFGLHPPAAWSS